MAAHQPTLESRKRVRSFSGFAVPQEQIAHLEGIDTKTLRKHYRRELDLGMAEANAAIGRSIFEQAIGRPAVYDPTTGALLREELKPDKSAAIFLSKTRLGMRETNQVQHVGKDGGPIQTTTMNLSALTDEELGLFESLLNKAEQRKSGGKT